MSLDEILNNGLDPSLLEVKKIAGHSEKKLEKDKDKLLNMDLLKILSTAEDTLLCILGNTPNPLDMQNQITLLNLTTVYKGTAIIFEKQFNALKETYELCTKKKDTKIQKAEDADYFLNIQEPAICGSILLELPKKKKPRIQPITLFDEEEVEISMRNQLKQFEITSFYDAAKDDDSIRKAEGSDEANAAVPLTFEESFQLMLHLPGEGPEIQNDRAEALDMDQRNISEEVSRMPHRSLMPLPSPLIQDTATPLPEVSDLLVPVEQEPIPRPVQRNRGRRSVGNINQQIDDHRGALFRRPAKQPNLLHLLPAPEWTPWYFTDIRPNVAISENDTFDESFRNKIRNVMAVVDPDSLANGFLLFPREDPERTIAAIQAPELPQEDHGTTIAPIHASELPRLDLQTTLAPIQAPEFPQETIEEIGPIVAVQEPTPAEIEDDLLVGPQSKRVRVSEPEIISQVTQPPAARGIPPAKELMLKIRNLWENMHGKITFDDICPCTTSTKLEASVTFSRLLSLGTKVVLSQDGTSSHQIYISKP